MLVEDVKLGGMVKGLEGSQDLTSDLTGGI